MKRVLSIVLLISVFLPESCKITVRRVVRRGNHVSLKNHFRHAKKKILLKICSWWILGSVTNPPLRAPTFREIKKYNSSNYTKNENWSPQTRSMYTAYGVSPIYFYGRLSSSFRSIIFKIIHQLVQQQVPLNSLLVSKNLSFHPKKGHKWHHDLRQSLQQP